MGIECLDATICHGGKDVYIIVIEKKNVITNENKEYNI